MILHLINGQKVTLIFSATVEEETSDVFLFNTFPEINFTSDMQEVIEPSEDYLTRCEKLGIEAITHEMILTKPACEWILNYEELVEDVYN